MQGIVKNVNGDDFRRYTKNLVFYLNSLRIFLYLKLFLDIIKIIAFNIIKIACYIAWYGYAGPVDKAV